MPDNRDKLTVGLTGSFGSGCSTLKESLAKLGFEPFSLSRYVKDKWQRKTGSPIEKAPRKELQDIGDEFRKTSGKTYYLAELAAKEAQASAENDKPLLFDNIRNIGEVEYLRKNYPNFFLIAVDCSPNIRWERVKKHYQDLGFNENQFEVDDKRDKYDERTKYGQSVDFCVDEADILIDNDKAFPTHTVALEKLKDKINPYINLMRREQTRTPNPFELYMGIAYTASLKSECVKRRVGAVIVDEKNNAIVSVGYNENPLPIEPCFRKYGQCYREIYKAKYFQHLESSKQKCPKCDVELHNLTALLVPEMRV